MIQPFLSYPLDFASIPRKITVVYKSKETLPCEKTAPERNEKTNAKTKLVRWTRDKVYTCRKAYARRLVCIRRLMHENGSTDNDQKQEKSYQENEMDKDGSEQDERHDSLLSR